LCKKKREEARGWREGKGSWAGWREVERQGGVKLKERRIEIICACEVREGVGVGWRERVGRERAREQEREDAGVGGRRETERRERIVFIYALDNSFFVPT
jgi:hypothetical protein